MRNPSSRRAVLAASVGFFAGCLGDDGGTETEPPTMPPPPWLREGAETDVLVSSPTDQSVEVTVSAGEWSRTVSLTPGERWQSPDVIAPDQETVVRIRGADTSLRVDWPPEGEGQHVLTAYVDPADGLIRASLLNSDEVLKRRRSTAGTATE